MQHLGRCLQNYEQPGKGGSQARHLFQCKNNQEEVAGSNCVRLAGVPLVHLWEHVSRDTAVITILVIGAWKPHLSQQATGLRTAEG